MSTDIKLRPYQEEFIDRIREQFKQGHKSVVGVMPCGSGKTITTGWMAKETASNGKRVLFMVHRHELIEQTSDTFYRLGIEHGIIAAGSPKDYDFPVQVASVQTLTRRLDEVPKPDLLICDECHHILANSYMKIINTWKPFLLGVTATPERRGGITLHDAFESMVIGPSVKQLISMGNLTPFDIYSAPFNVDFKKMRTDNFGDFRSDDMSNLLDRQNIIGDVVKNYQLYAKNSQTIVYCINVRHSKHTADAFKENGIRAAHVDGDTPKTERDEIIEDFRNKRIQVLCNAELFGEGFDVPNMETVILSRPTQSLTLYIQQAMRAMRPDPDNPNKRAIIIDHVENSRRFGAPDKDKSWSLDPNKEKSAGETPLKECPECRTVIPLAARCCPTIISEKHSIENIFFDERSFTISYFAFGEDFVLYDGYLEMHVCPTSSKLHYRATCELPVPSSKKDKIIQVASIKQTHSYLTVKCLHSEYSIKHGTVEGEDGVEYDTYALCKDKKILKSFLDKNGNLICGHIFLFRDAEIKDEDIIIKVYESEKGELTTEEQMTKILERPESIEALLVVASKKGYKQGWAAMQAVKHAETYQDFLHIAEICGYKKGWAYHQWKNRDPNKQEQSELDDFSAKWNNRHNALKKSGTSLFQT